MSSESPPPGEGILIRSVYYLYLLVAFVARSLPERFAYRCAHWAARVKARVTSRQAEVVARNLARVIGEPPGSPKVRELTVAAYESYGRYWMETFRYAEKGPEFWMERFQLEGAEHLDRALAGGRGAVILVGHCGNWDAAGAYLSVTGRPAVAVAEVLRPRRLYDFFVSHRARLGMTIRPANKGVTRTLLGDLERGGLVAILGDRDLRGSGPQVTFFGETATFAGGPASLALRARVPLLVGAVHSHVFPDGRRGWRGRITEPIALPEGSGREAIGSLTQEAASRLEALIEEHPEEWHVFGPFWLADRKAP